MNDDDSPLIAFVHIGKAGGTTLIHILRRNFFMQALDARPLSPASHGVFSADDFRKVRKLNPRIRCIMGHSVRAYSDLASAVSNVRYITLLRNPVNRCVSQYLQRVNKHGHIEFNEFISRNWLPNLQTRFIAGSDDLPAAKELLDKDFFHVGVLEQFDAFLAIFRKCLGDSKFDVRYRKMRVAKDNEMKQEIISKYAERITEIHQSDLELYDFATSVLLPRQKTWYGESLEADIAHQKEANSSWSPPRFKLLLDAAVRKLYYEPVTGMIRRSNGMPATGLR